jgi:hypothetical protein
MEKNGLVVSFPDTDQVRRAKADILAGMQDRYDELLGQGRSEAESIGTVIQEFGTVEELAGELGAAADADPARLAPEPYQPWQIAIDAVGGLMVAGVAFAAIAAGLNAHATRGA